jgi:5-methylcytosine-specific restriction enzyme subunit McrC
MSEKKYLNLQEHKTTSFKASDITDDMYRVLHNNYSDCIQINSPSISTNYEWQLTPNGRVGFIPLPENTILNLIPKVQISNIFEMITYAYNLRSFKFLDELVRSEQFEGYFDKLANILANMINARVRKGLYCSYINKNEHINYIRGRINFPVYARLITKNIIPCCYEERSADIKENQVLLWTLKCILCSNLCSKNTSDLIRKAYRSLCRAVFLVPFRSHEAVCKSYHRLNSDYYPMHCICRFFLDHCTPSHMTGTHDVTPFLVNMPNLFESFVAEWMKAHLPQGYSIKAQEQYDFDPQGKISFKIDIVLYDEANDLVKAVLDTKYKLSNTPETSDIHQILAYAYAKKSKEAILIFPSDTTEHIDRTINEIRVRNVIFSLDGNLSDAGEKMLNNILHH